MPVRGVLLDADDTLIDTRRAMHAAGASAARALWPAADPDRLADAGRRFRVDPEGHFASYTRGECDFATMRRRRVEALARWLDQGVADDLHLRFEASYEPAFAADIVAFADAVPAVDAIRGRGIPVGVLTNSGADYTAAKLRATGLDHRFDAICTRDTLGFGKPDPRAFHEACRRLGTEPGATLYAGDEWVPDALGAHEAGLIAVWLLRDEPAEASRALAGEHGIPIVRDLTDLLDACCG